MRPTITLVDGYRHSGRPAFAAALATHLNAQHFIGTRNTPAWQFVQAMQPALDDKYPVVIERSWQFERYCLYIGKGSIITKEHSRMLDRLALARDGNLIKIIPDVGQLIEAAKAINTPPDQMIHIAANSEMWRAFAIPLPCVEFEDIKMDPDAVVESVQAYSSNAGPGIGMWYPDNSILLVGDTHGPSKQPYQLALNIAFCDMAKSGSSYWLASVLEAANIPEYKLYWINARDSKGVWTDSNFVRHLRPKQIIALGAQAEKWCIDNDLKFARIPHPQYHYRFNHNEPYPLVKMLT